MNKLKGLDLNKSSRPLKPMPLVSARFYCFYLDVLSGTGTVDEQSPVGSEEGCHGDRLSTNMAQEEPWLLPLQSSLTKHCLA